MSDQTDHRSASPTESPAAPPIIPPNVASTPGAARPRSGVETYNVISDTIVGVNLRGKDNLFQLIAILVALLIGTGIGAMMSPRDRITGALLGGFCGVLAGLLLSGAGLRIYHAIRHAHGRHD